MHWMHTSVRPISIPPMCTSRLAYNFCRMARRLLAPRTRATPPYRKTFTLKLTSLLLSMALPLLNGALLSLNNLRKVLLPQP
jgi:hypothetical protein